MLQLQGHSGKRKGTVLMTVTRKNTNQDDRDACKLRGGEKPLCATISDMLLFSVVCLALWVSCCTAENVDPYLERARELMSQTPLIDG